MSGRGFGAFGKIPATGDFFRINAPPGFVGPWDEWLQRCIVSGAHTFGEKWDELYMSVPIWRFCLSPGLAGEAKILGVLMPSVDSVGRRFPLTLAAALPKEGPLLLDHFLNSDLFARLEEIALATLEDGASSDALAKALEEAPDPLQQPHARFSHIDGATSVERAKTQTELLALLAAQGPAAGNARSSVWSAALEDDLRLMICDGLPEGPQMQALFDLEAPLWAKEAA
ncbi:MAG: type VI secretion system-associated protein TagF [Sulfitobacter sp.]|nr:type VI secretion system-associated protein TagF [Sulfitobacter sp.]